MIAILREEPIIRGQGPVQLMFRSLTIQDSSL
jgi:hypothetical protein